MSGTSRRWGSLSDSVARTGERIFLESASGTLSGSGLAGRELGCRLLGERRDAAALHWVQNRPSQTPDGVSCSHSRCGHLWLTDHNTHGLAHLPDSRIVLGTVRRGQLCGAPRLSPLVHEEALCPSPLTA